MTTWQLLGKPTPQVGAVDKVTGRARYTDDLRVHDPLHVKILRAPHASAKIKSVDVSAAKALPGVRAILTGADFKRTFGVLPISRDEPALARDRVRYVGEPVAAVAADSARLAEAALAAIRVDYEVTPAVLSFEEARRETKTPLHPELEKPNNLHKLVQQSFGDLAKGFADAAVTAEGEFRFLPVTHAFTEPHAVQVEHDGELLVVTSATQVPHYVHLALSEVLELPPHRLRVVKPHLGGGFGGKSDPFPHEMIAAKFALVTGRNIRLVYEREEVFLSNHGRHPTELKMKLGLHPERGVTALDTKVMIDGGAYGSFGVVTTYYNGVLLQGPYPVPNSAFQCERFYTNKPMCGAMRGHGGVNPRFASETLMDMACVQAGLDPLEARLKFLHTGDTMTPNGFRITSAGLREGLAEAAQRTKWKEKWGKLPHGKGIGVACGFFISGSALPIHRNELPQSTVRLTIDFDGGLTVYSGASDIGQGSDTMLALVVAEVLGAPLSLVKVVSADTRLTPIDLGSYSSRVTFMAGNAARNAAISMRKELVAAAARLSGRAPPEYPKPGEPESPFRLGQRPPDFDSHFLGPNPDYRDGWTFANLTVTPDGGAALDYFQVVTAALAGRGILQTQGVYQSPKLEGGKHKGAGAGLSPSYSFTAVISEVDVDVETGFVRVEKITCAHDCGMQLNPLAVEGQLEGSIHMGLGQALMEGMAYEAGAVQNASFLEYKIPSAFEQPVIELVRCPSVDNEGPFGAKEVGEGALAPVVPSIANAIYDAVGVRLMRVPMTPEVVLAALAARRGR